MPVTEADVIVVGGGVAGLTAAAKLARARRRVILIEARDRLGGRVWTHRRTGWDAPVELGAEFVHEGNTAFWRLLKNHRIGARQVPSTHWLAAPHGVKRIAELTDQIAEVTELIDPRRMAGWSFADFLRRKSSELPGEAAQLAAEFVEGFQAAPMGKMSAVAVEGETLDVSAQFALPGGYDRVVAALEKDLREAGGVICRETVAREIAWSRGKVVVRASEFAFAARAAIIALPLGVLQAKTSVRGAVRFTPRLLAKEKLIARMEVGHVIRITVRFDARAWRRLLPAELRRRRGGIGFIHSRVAGVPTWWSLSPNPVLTGWAGGPKAVKLAGRANAAIRERALSSLSELLNVDRARLKAAARDFAAHNWSRDPFSRGAYSFIAAGRDDASEKLRAPAQDTLFFAGEATADDAEIGTVHGAFTSGLRAAKEVARALRRSTPLSSIR